MVDAESGFTTDQTGDDVVAQVGQFRLVLRLRVTEQDSLEAGIFRSSRERKVDRSGQRSGGRHAGMALGNWAAEGMVQIGKAWETVRRVGRIPVGRLDDKHAVALGDRQPPSAIRIGAGYIATVRDQDIRKAGVAMPALDTAAARLEN